MLLSLMQAHPRNTTRATYADLLDRLFASTLGTLVRQICSAAEADAQKHLEEILANAANEA